MKPILSKRLEAIETFLRTSTQDTSWGMQAVYERIDSGPLYPC